MSSLDIKATKVFQKNWESDKKIIVNRGGTRSSKTRSILQMCFVWLISWKIDNTWKVFSSWVLSIVRKYSATLNATAIRDWENIIAESSYSFLLSDKHRNKSDKTYTYNGRMVEFFGADDEQKIRWRGRDILYCNEANELRYDQEFHQLLIRTTYKIIIDFNPDDEWVRINTELEQKRAITEWDVDIIVSTYKDNPYINESIIKEIEYLWKTNPLYWRVYWLWEYGRVEWLVFQWWEEVSDVSDDYELLWYWQDFGYSNDPTAIIGLYKYKDGILFDECLYERWLTNQDIWNKYIDIWVWKYDEIVADSSEPKSIEEIYRMWYNIHPAEKWPDSIKFGIDLLKQHKVYYTSRSNNLRKELRVYSRKKDKNWNYLPIPVDTNNHLLDACRYIATRKLKRDDPVIFINDDRYI